MPKGRFSALTVVNAAVAAGVIASGGAEHTEALDLRHPRMRLTAMDTGSAADPPPDIVIDFVRHAQTDPSSATIAVASQGLPGFPLSKTGEEQAQQVGQEMFDKFGGPHGVAGIFGGQEQRMIETATPFDHLEHMQMQPLAGLDEIGGGIFAHAPPDSLGDLLSILTALPWAFGLDFVWRPGSNDYNGAQFEENVDAAIDTMYHDALDAPGGPVVSANGHVTDVAFSGDGAISDWIVQNVKNPDLAILLPIALHAASSGSITANAGQDVIEGNAADGWTLLSFDGHAIPTDPGLFTELFVDVRDLISTPQIAVWNVIEAALTDHATAIGPALDAGFESVGTALAAFPGSVVSDITDELGRLSADLSAGESFVDAFDSTILGLT